MGVRCKFVNTHSLELDVYYAANMPPCSECKQHFDEAQGVRDHINAIHKRLFCPMCKGGPFTAGGLTMVSEPSHIRWRRIDSPFPEKHARAKHPKKCRKILHTCRTCEFYTADSALLKQHYRTSAVHKSCDTCDEPFYDLPMPNSVSNPVR